MKRTIVIIGGGLSGLSAAYHVSQLDEYQVVILEQGVAYTERITNPNCSLLVGLGGAGTVFGGKLCFPPASGALWKKTEARKHSLPSFTRDLLHSCATTLQPHFYADDIRDRVNGIEEKQYCSRLLLQDDMHSYVESLIDAVRHRNVEIRCGCTVQTYLYGIGGKQIVFRNEVGETETLNTDYIIFATGRSSRELIYRCFPNEIISDMPDLGIRLTLDKKCQQLFSQVGQDVKLKLRDGAYLTRTFCVCTGGASTKVNLNGMDYYDGHFRSELTDDVNFGILSRSIHHSGRYAVDNYLKDMAKYADQAISLKDFSDQFELLAANTSYAPLFAAVARFTNRLYDTGLIGQRKNEIPVFLPSIDNLCPQVRTSEDFETHTPGVYVVGDAAGISRGFVQALWTGKCAADSIRENTYSNRCQKWAF